MTTSAGVLVVGSLTRWAGRPWRVAAVGCISGERYYWLIDRYGTVSMLPAVALTASSRRQAAARVHVGATTDQATSR